MQLGFAVSDLRAALETLVADFDAIPEDENVPDAINVNEHWDVARAVLKKYEAK